MDKSRVHTIEKYNRSVHGKSEHHFGEEDKEAVENKIGRVLVVQPPTNRFKEDDNIYYNVVIRNKNRDSLNTFVEAVFETSRPDIILNKASDYQLTIPRFKIPTTQIPYFYFEEDSKGNSIYWVALTYLGVAYTERVEYKSVDTPPITTGLKPIYDIQQFLDSINAAYVLAYNALIAANPGLVGLGLTQAPFIAYDSETRLFTAYKQIAYVTQNVGMNMNWFVGNFFFFYTQNLGSSALVANYQFEIIFQNLQVNTIVINGTNWYFNVQTRRTVVNWQEFQDIVFFTNTIPVSSEFLPPSSESSQPTRRILTDFEPLESNSGFQEPIQYFSSGYLRWLDLKSEEPLRNIDIRIFWQDRAGRLFPIYLSYNDVVTVKLQFRKKGFHHVP